MELQKLNVKLFVEQPDSISLTDFIEVFHNWIQATDGVYHDVADYSHMQAGPGIVLVAKDAHVSIDESGNRRGLVYSQKAVLVGTPRDMLRHVFRAALKNCRQLEAEPALAGKLRFAANEAVISLNDRRLGANSSACFDEFKQAIEAFVNQLYAGAEVNFERDAEPRRRLNVRVKTSASVDLAQALDNLSRN